jgi:hypothetical protein
MERLEAKVDRTQDALGVPTPPPGDEAAGGASPFHGG